MKYRIALVFVLFTCRFSLKAQEMPAVSIYASAKDAVVRLVALNNNGEVLRTGSGFFIDAKGSVLTCNHLMRDAASMLVISADEDTFAVKKIYKSSAEGDYCFLGIVNAYQKQLKFLRTTSVKPVIGEDIFVVGHPKGLSYSITNGIVSGLRSINGEDYIQFTAPVSPGNSGGPLINRKGEAIGIISFNKPDGQSLNFASDIGNVTR